MCPNRIRALYIRMRHDEQQIDGIRPAPQSVTRRLAGARRKRIERVERGLSFELLQMGDGIGVLHLYRETIAVVGGREELGLPAILVVNLIADPDGESRSKRS